MGQFTASAPTNQCRLGCNGHICTVNPGASRESVAGENPGNPTYWQKNSAESRDPTIRQNNSANSAAEGGGGASMAHPTVQRREVVRSAGQKKMEASLRLGTGTAWPRERLKVSQHKHVGAEPFKHMQIIPARDPMLCNCRQVLVHVIPQVSEDGD